MARLEVHLVGGAKREMHRGGGAWCHSLKQFLSFLS